jgi:hypothetical protein
MRQDVDGTGNIPDSLTNHGTAQEKCGYSRMVTRAAMIVELRRSLIGSLAEASLFQHQRRPALLDDLKREVTIPATNEVLVSGIFGGGPAKCACPWNGLAGKLRPGPALLLPKAAANGRVRAHSLPW